MMNILLTCAGRRNYLLGYFRAALNGRGQVYAADTSAQAPAMQEADRAFVVPPVDRADYVEHLLVLCKEHNVRLIVPLNDMELPVLARQRQRFSEIDVIPVVSSPDVINTCFDKYATVSFSQRCGLAAPKTYLSLAHARAALTRGELRLPLVVKPRWGTASIGIEFPHDDEELELAYRLVRKRLKRTMLAALSATDTERSVLIQEHLPGQEYGLDIVNDLDGRYVTTFARQKLGMRAGETDRAVTCSNERLERLGALIGQRLGHVGNLDCDVFVGQEQCALLEMNPRFGGGYPFSHVAGANVPAVLIAWANGTEPSSDWLRIQPDVMAAKCDRLVISSHRGDSIGIT